jgi:hypothetical protein
MNAGCHAKWVVLLLATAACRRSTPDAPPPPASPDPGAARDAALLAAVVDPWRWPRARGASDRERAIEDIGPYERDGGPAATAPINTNADYWTRLVGLAWDRDVDIDLDGEPVDLDGDGAPDTRVTRHMHAPGGVLANPGLFGLTPTPDDPRGRVGRVSASTGVLGLREALRPDGTPSGQIGMTCWLCHGAADPTTGALAPGLPGTRFDYGLLLATAAVLDDGDAAAARRARGFPPGRTVRARLLLAGPGRQDLTGEFGLDVTVPGYHSARYPGTRRVRQGIHGVVNPISVPAILAAPGLALQNWSGSENAAAPFLERLVALAGRPTPEVVGAFGLGAAAVTATAGPDPDRALSRRALLLDLRNLGTLGLQQDSFPGLLWADALRARATLSPAALAEVPRLYGTVAVRRTIAETAAHLAHPPADPERVARGRALFADRVIGEIANRQVLKQAPRAYAAAKLDGPEAGGLVILAPIDPTRPLAARLAVRCADCHNGSPLEQRAPLTRNPPPVGRCTHCHAAHPALVARPEGGKPRLDLSTDDPVSIATMAVPAPAPAEVAYCAGCHQTHRVFGPVVYSGSRLLPFDADGDGDAQGDPAADARAGGIGTDPLLAFDVPRPQRPFSLDAAILSDATRPGRVTRARTGAAWVRVPPLVAIHATAPYLHNGSVPTLRALFEPASRRPTRFPLGQAGFVFDTALPGNRNTGHEFGTRLTPAEKEDLIAFLQSL